MRQILSAVLLAITAQAALAGEKKPANKEFDVRPSSWPILAKTEGSEFSIDPNLVDKLFESTTTSENKPEPAYSPSARIEAGFGYLLCTNMILRNEYFEVPYSKNTPSLSYGLIQASKPIVSTPLWYLNAYGMSGFSYQQGIYDVTGNSGIRLKDTVTLQWVPLEAGVSATTTVLSGKIKPALNCGIGADWISQSGTLDGINQVFWVPHVSIGPAATFFGASDDALGFAGITFSSFYRSSISSKQDFTGWSFNLTSRFAM